MAFLEQGDEVIMFEPFFDQYLPSVTFNGGIPVYVPLHPDMSKPKITSNDWTIDFEELRYVALGAKAITLTHELYPDELLPLEPK